MGNNQKLSIIEKCAYGAGDLACNLFWGLVCVASAFYTEYYGISAAAAATMMLIVSYFDLVLDVFIGAAADRFDTKWGKFRPWILYGFVPFCVIGFFAFFTPGFADFGKIVYAYVTYLLFRIMYSVVNVPYGAMLGVISEDPKERDSVSAYRNVGAQIGFFLSFAMVFKFVNFAQGATTVSNSTAFSYVVAVYTVLALALLFFCFSCTKERVKPVKEENNSLGQDLKDLVTNRPWISLSIAGIALILFTACHNMCVAYYAKYYIAETVVVEEGSKIVGVSQDNSGKDIYVLENGRVDSLSKGSIVTRTIVDGKEEVATVSIERSFAAMNAEGEMASIEKVRGDGAKPEQGDYVTYFKYDVNGSFWGMKLDWELFYTLIAGMGTLLTILGTMLIQPVVRKFGKKETWLSCFVISGLVSLVFIVLGKDSFSTIIIFNWLFSLIIGPTGFIMWSMYADVADNAEVKTGRRATGLIYSSATIAQKFGYANANSLPLFFLAAVGFVSNDLSMSLETKEMVKYVFALVPLVGAVLGVLALFFYNINEEKIIENSAKLAELKKGK